MEYFDKRDNVSWCEFGTDTVSNQFVSDGTHVQGSQIQEFYENKNVFVTDADGPGILLVERLLRTCPKIGTIYLLMKQEKKKLQEGKHDEFFISEVCHKINQTYQYLKTKIKIVYGDYTQPYCGISKPDQNILNDVVQIVFHFTGTANKYQNLRSLCCDNIQSTRSLLELASKMKKLKAFVYVSTMHTKRFQPDVEEKLYERIFSNNNLKSWEEQLQALAPKIVGSRGDLNDFTKAIGEKIVRKCHGTIPIAIARSSNEGCNHKNNILNWKQLFKLSTGIHPMLIRALRYYTCGTKNSMTTDNFIKTIVAISWQIGTKKSNRNHINVPVYDVFPPFNSRIPTNCGDFEHLSGNTNLICQATSKYSEMNKLDENNPTWMDYHNKYIYPVLFLLMLNLYLKIYANTYKLLNTFVKTDDCSLSVEYYHSKLWVNKMSNVDKLWSSMSNVDKKLLNYDINIKNHDWKQCSSRSIRNMIAYTFKEDLSDSEMVNENYARYQNFKKCLKILFYSFTFSYILNKYFLSLLKFMNELML